jgi:ribosomal 30S subunit maturation factor RimM
LGIVKAVYNFGAGDLIELANIPGVKGVRLVPFTKETVPSVELSRKRITVQRSAADPAEDTTS